MARFGTFPVHRLTGFFSGYVVAGVASASVRSNEKASVKELSNLNEATVGEVAAALKLLARERPHQSFLQSDLEEALGAKN